MKVRRGDISHAVVVRTRKEYGRADGSYIRFDDNACVLINKSGDPLGTRLSGNPTILPKPYTTWEEMADQGFRCRWARTQEKEVVKDIISCPGLCINVYQTKTFVHTKLNFYLHQSMKHREQAPGISIKLIPHHMPTSKCEGKNEPATTPSTTRQRIING